MLKNYYKFVVVCENLHRQSGHAYKCYCSEERLEKLRAEGAATGFGSKYDRRCLSLTKEEQRALEEKNVPYVIRMKV